MVPWFLVRGDFPLGDVLSLQSLRVRNVNSAVNKKIRGNRLRSGGEHGRLCYVDLIL
jgi:hypothetical protein